MDHLQLGQLLGRRQAFNFVASRCTATDAAGLRQMRQDRLWEGYASSWKVFCSFHLHLSASQANRIIQTLEEFGAAYFDVAQLTRVSPEVYRIVAPAIQQHAIHLEGEPIALIQENAALVAGAVEHLRKSARQSARPVPPPPPVPAPTFAQRFAALDLRCDDVVSEFTALIRMASHKQELSALLCRLQTSLDRLEKEVS